MGLLEESKWRYATKKFDPSKKVDQQAVDKIVEAAYLAPTSSGLQPFKVLVITNPELKEKIFPIAKNQQQIIDSSHLLVFAGWDNYTEERIDHIYKLITTERGQDKDQYKPYTDYIKSIYLNSSEHSNFEHIARQVYIGFAYSIAMAAELKIDTTPMEGFDSNELDELLDLKKQGLKSVVILPLGYRDADNDWLVNLKKVRHPKSEFIIEIK